MHAQFIHGHVLRVNSRIYTRHKHPPTKAEKEDLFISKGRERIYSSAKAKRGFICLCGTKESTFVSKRTEEVRDYNAESVPLKRNIRIKS